MFSRRDGLPINKGVIVVPDDKTPHGAYWGYVVNPEKGHVLDCNNNLMNIENLEDYWVLTEDLIIEEWYLNRYRFGGPCIDKAYMSEIAAGCHDSRFDR